MKYILERRNVDDEWHMWGTYSDKSLSQMIQACMELAVAGYEMYYSLRIRKVDENGETNIL